MKKINAIVVDDEASNRNLIKKLIDEIGSNFDIIGEAKGVNSAYELIVKLSPDVVFLDIKMPDGSGFELLEKFEKIDFEVVFVSGFDSYALKAFEFSALDYVIKPIDLEKFTKTLKKVESSIERKGLDPSNFQSILQSYDPKQMIMTKIPIHTFNKVTLLPVEDIVYLESQDGCTQFMTISGEKFISSKQLSDFEFIIEHLPQLVRVNRSTFININYVSSYSKGEPCIVEMKDEKVIEISRRKKSEILGLLSNIIRRKQV